MASGVQQVKTGQSRKRWRVTPRFWTLLVAVFVLYMTVSSATGFVQIWRVKKEIARVRAEIEAIEAHNQALREELAYLQSDEYIEKVARGRAGLGHAGRDAVIIAPPAPGESGVTGR